MYFNQKQIAFLKARQKQKLFLGGRGVGKTTVMGEAQYRSAAQFPRGKGFLSSSTYAQILTKSIPEMQAIWEKHGLIEDFHYVIGKKPPKSYVKPVKPPKRFENIITFGNGYNIELLSMDRPDLARGGSFDCGDIDEAALVKKEAYTRVILPSVRGNRERFAHIPEHHQVRLYTSVPWKPSGYWVLNFEEWAMEEPEDFFFLEATTLDNIAVLGMDFIKRLEKTLPWLEYQIEILNRRITKIQGGYYHKFDPDRHCKIDTYNYGLGERGITVKGDKDINPRALIDLSFDFGGHFNCALALQQGRNNQVNILKEFFTKDERKLRELVADFCDYYKEHKKKYVRLWGEPRGNDRQPDSEPLFHRARSYFESHGWTAEICATHIAADHVARYNLMSTLFDESDDNYPIVRINANNCKNLILVLQTTDIKDDLKKDKHKEKDPNFPQEQAPHLGDCLDNFMTQCYNHLLNSDDSLWLPNSTGFL